MHLLCTRHLRRTSDRQCGRGERRAGELGAAESMQASGGCAKHGASKSSDLASRWQPSSRRPLGAETQPITTYCSTCFVLWLLCCTCGTLKMGVLACTRAHTHTLPPLDHAPIHQRCCPAPSPAHQCWCWCLSHAMRGALRSEVRLRIGADRPAGPRCPKQARVGAPRPPPNSRLPALPSHHHKQTWHQITHAGRGKGRSAVPADQGRRVRVHRSASRYHRQSPRKLRCPASIALFGADIWLKQATQYITKKLLLTHGLNRPQYKT